MSARYAFLIAASAVMYGCGSGDSATQAAQTPAQPAAEPAAATTGAAPATTGRVVEVQMITNGAENRFEPAEVRASPGDVVRFTLVGGVHNVSFPAAKNGGAGNLPAASPYLQQPGQTYDLPVELAPGSYTFQCDPHAMMGMVGTLTVE